MATWPEQLKTTKTNRQLLKQLQYITEKKSLLIQNFFQTSILPKNKINNQRGYPTQSIDYSLTSKKFKLDKFYA